MQNGECEGKHIESFGFTKYPDRKQENYSKVRTGGDRKELISVPKLYSFGTESDNIESVLKDPPSFVFCSAENVPENCILNGLKFYSSRSRIGDCGQRMSQIKKVIDGGRIYTDSPCGFVFARINLQSLALMISSLSDFSLCCEGSKF